MYLLFETLQEAETANSQISENMKFTGDITTAWDIPQGTDEGKFIITKPDDKFMTGVNNFQEI